MMTNKRKTDDFSDTSCHHESRSSNDESDSKTVSKSNIVKRSQEEEGEPRSDTVIGKSSSGQK